MTQRLLHKSEQVHECATEESNYISAMAGLCPDRLKGIQAQSIHSHANGASRMVNQ